MDHALYLDCGRGAKPGAGCLFEDDVFPVGLDGPGCGVDRQRE